MTRLRHVLLFAVIVAVGYAPAAMSLWHCGDIELAGTPGAMVLDPISGDIFLSTDEAWLVRIDEATTTASTIGLAARASGLGLNPATRYLYGFHGDSDLVTLLNIDTSDTTLIAVGGTPTGIAIDPLQDMAYVINAGDSTISAIQGTAVAFTLKCAGRPSAVAVDPGVGRAFAAVEDGNLLFAFDASGVDTSYFPTGSAPSAMEVDPEKGRIYIANSGENTITVFMTDSDSLLTVDVGGQPVALTLNPETQRLYVGTSSGSVVVIDTDTYTTQSVTLPSPVGSIAIDALSDRTFATLPGMDLLVEMTSTGDTLMAAVPGTPGTLLINPVTNKCFVCNLSAQSLSVFEAANYSGIRLAAGGGPGEMRINLETHKVYTPNYYSKTVTVIDGYTNAISTVPAADGPNGLRVDPITDNVYVVCAWGNKLTILQEGGSDTLLVPIGGYAHGIGINPNTGKVYVSNRSSRDLSIIDIQTLDTTLVRTGPYPCHVDINIEHNKIYIPNRTGWTITAVDGALLTTAFGEVGPGPTGTYVDPVNNKIMTNDASGRTMSVLDAVTLERVVVPVGTTPRSLAMNNNTNRIYVSSGVDGEITVVDAATYTRTPVRCESGLFEVEIDPWLDKVYSVSWDRAAVYLVDGNFLTSLKIPVGEEPHSSAYDPVLEKLYVSNHAYNSVEIIQLREKITPRIEVVIDTLPGDVAYTTTPTITGTATSLRSPQNYGVMKVLYKIDNLRGAWQEATLLGDGEIVAWQCSSSPLLLGRHLIFVTAIDSTACSLCSSSSASLLRMSDMACYEFTCLSPAPEAPERVVAEEGLGAGLSLAWSNTCGPQGWYDLEIAPDPEFSQDVVKIGGLTEPFYSLSTESRAGAYYWRVTAVDYPHAKQSQTSDTYAVSLSDLVDRVDPRSISLVAYPNPSPQAVWFSLLGHGATQARCSIYDVTGRLVNTLWLVPSSEGLSGKWNGRDTEGKPLPPGVYYASVAGIGTDLKHKIIIVR